MEVSIKGFIYHKTAEKYADCFDRIGVNVKTNKLAISDGVSKSFFPDIWAELLVEFFLKNEGRINIANIDEYKAIQNEWLKKVSEIVNKPNQKYFVRNFFIQGRPAAATFVGLHFYKDNTSLKWEAVALGDSFLFFIPKDVENINENFNKVIHLSSKNDFEFNNFPDFFDSRSHTHKGRISQREYNLTGGTFYLMTDALAEWFISEKQAAIQEISKWKSQDTFEKSVIQLRKTTLYNDDSAILIVNIEEDNIPEIHYKEILVTKLDELIETENKAIKNEITEHIIVPSLETVKESKEEIPILNESHEESKLVAFKDDNEQSNVDSLKAKNEKVINPTIVIETNKETSLTEIENNNKEIKKRKIRFWERFIPQSWMNRHNTEHEFKNEKNEEDADVNNAGMDKSDTIQYELIYRQDYIEIQEEPENTEEKEEGNDENDESRTKPNDDISSITEKF